MYTPHGLKIRIDEAEAFAYLGRLFPQVAPREFLLLLEGLDNFPLLWTVWTGWAVIPEKKGWGLILCLLVVFAVTKSILVWWQPYLLGRWCYFLTRWPIVLIIWAGSIYKLVKYCHWVGLLYAVGFLVLLVLVSGVLELVFAELGTKRLKRPVTTAEIQFFGLFQHTARFFEKNDTLQLTEKELSPTWWRQFAFLK